MEIIMKKLIALALIAFSTFSFAAEQVSVMGKYVDQTGNNYIDFGVNDYTPRGVIDFKGRLAEEGKEYHTGFMIELTFDQYKKIFESNSDVSLSLIEGSSDECLIEASSNGNIRTVVMTTEVYNENVYLAKKVFSMTIVDGRIVEIAHKVKRKKHALILFTVPGIYDYFDVATAVSSEREGLGVYGDNERWPLGKILSYENIINELGDSGTSVKYCE